MESYKHKDNKFAYILKKAAKVGFNQPHYINNKALITYWHLKDTLFKDNSSRLVVVKLDFKEYVPVIYKDKYKQEKNAFENIKAYYFEDHICYEDSLKNQILKNETLFILFDCPNYAYSWDKTHVTHSTCAIIHKNKCYYMNPHGNCSGEEFNKWYNWNEEEEMLYYNEFSQNVDREVVSCLMSEMGVKYDNSQCGRYDGLALQEYDNYGCCFIFPVAIWFEFENNFKLSLKLLERGLLSMFIENVVTGTTNTRIYKISSRDILSVNQTSLSNIKTFINKSKHRFIRNTLNKYIGYMTQKKIQDKINY